jgi:prolyl oligopeptidase
MLDTSGVKIMKRSFKVILALALMGTPIATPQSPTPPAARVRATTENYFGIPVTDPYRYMENLKDPEVAASFKGQSDYTRAVLDRIPGRAGLLSRIKLLDESTPARVSDLRRLPGERYFYLKRLATEDVAKLYTRAGVGGAEALLVDPMKLAGQGSHSVISYYSPSIDGRYVVYGISPGGSEDAVIHVVETASGRETGDLIDRAQFGSPSWSPDGGSFFYNRQQKLGPTTPATERELKSRVYLHRLGTDPEKDREVMGFDLSPAVRMVETDIPFVTTIPESREVVATVAHGVQNEATLYAAPLDSIDRPQIPWRKLCDVDDQVAAFAARGSELYFITHKNASRYEVTRTDLNHPDAARGSGVTPKPGSDSEYLGGARWSLRTGDGRRRGKAGADSLRRPAGDGAAAICGRGRGGRLRSTAARGFAEYDFMDESG